MLAGRMASVSASPPLGNPTSGRARLRQKNLCGFRAAILAATLVGSSVAAIGQSPPKLVRDEQGAIVRGNLSVKSLALIFTGDEHGQDTAAILDTLAHRRAPAAFFVTGNFLRRSELRPLIRRAVAEGHYVGPHSDSHPLYCSWEDRRTTLVTREFFSADLQKNIADLRALGALKDERPILFIPPYEWHNREQVEWSRALGVTLINFTPGSGSNRDYAPEGDPRFVPARTIYNDILTYERKDPHGLNGFILLMHLGSGRRDRLQPYLGPLCDELVKRGYDVKRVDKLLSNSE